MIHNLEVHTKSGILYSIYLQCKLYDDVRSFQLTRLEACNIYYISAPEEDNCNTLYIVGILIRFFTLKSGNILKVERSPKEHMHVFTRI